MLEEPPSGTVVTAPPQTSPGAPGGRDDLRCPLCEYDLRGLTEPRCPECGYRFNWSDLTDPAKRLHPYLFEHHPEQKARSFLRTHLNAMRPKHFWTSLLPAQPSFPRRLVLYWCIAAAVMVPVLTGHYVLWAKSYAAFTRAERARWAKIFPPGSAQYRDLVRHYGSYQKFEDSNWPLPPAGGFFQRAWEAERGYTTGFAIALLAWPWATFLALLVFRVSMRRARIKPVHVLRCVLYSFDAYAWVALAVGAAVAYRAMLTWDGLRTSPNLPLAFVPQAPIPTGMPFSYRADMVPDTLFWTGLAALLFMTYRLASAFRHYLKFDHPVATVLASQLIVVLAALVAAVRLLIE